MVDLTCGMYPRNQGSWVCTCWVGYICWLGNTVASSSRSARLVKSLANSKTACTKSGSPSRALSPENSSLISAELLVDSKSERPAEASDKTSSAILSCAVCSVKNLEMLSFVTERELE